MALPVLSKVLEVMLEPEDAPPLFLELFKGFEFTDAELQALNAVCKQPQRPPLSAHACCWSVSCHSVCCSSSTSTDAAAPEPTSS